MKGRQISFVLSALCAHTPRAKHSILIRWVQRLQQTRESDSHWTCLIALSKAVQRLSGKSKTDPYISNFVELSQPERDRKGQEDSEGKILCTAGDNSPRTHCALPGDLQGWP